MISKYVPYLLLFVVGCLCLTGGLCADEPKAAAAAAKAEADEAAAVAAAAVEVAAKAAVKAEKAAAAAAKALAAAKAAAKAAADAKKPETQVKKALAQIKKSVEAQEKLLVSLNAAWSSAKDLPATKKAREVALKAAGDASDAVKKARQQVMPEATDEEKNQLEQNLKDKQLEYATARNLLEVADSLHQRNVSDLRKALELAKTSHQAAIDLAAKMEELLNTIATKESEATKVAQKPKAAGQATQRDQETGSSAPETIGHSAPSAAPATGAAIPDPPTAGSQATGTPIPPNPYVRAMNRPATDLEHVDAFRQLPLIEEIKHAQTLGDFDRTTNTVSAGNGFPNGTGTASTASETSTPEFVCDYRFDRPAHFPLPAFGLGGESFDDSGLIIYEGMRLAVKSDGRYQIRFVVGTPAVPVEMKLQFVLEDQTTYKRHTLTLPRVAIPPKNKPAFASQRNHVEPIYQGVQTVHHEGYLPFLAQQAAVFRVVRRSGTARFGFGVDVP